MNRLSAGRLLLAVGDSANAAAIKTWTDALVAYAAHESHVNAVAAGYAYYERAAIAEAQGKSALAAYLYRRFLDRVDLPRASRRAQAEHAAGFIAAQR